MVRYTDEEVRNSLRKFLSRVKKKFKIEKALLFGSRARGDSLMHSDVDLILVSEDFKSYKFMDRMAEIIGEWDGAVDLEVICYTPQEFERKRKQIGIIQKAVEEGVDIN
jgi:hypothetical protein